MHAGLRNDSRIKLAYITGALWAKRGKRGILREARDEERTQKIKRLLPVHCSGSSAHLRPQVLTEGGDVNTTRNQNTIHYSKIVALLATWDTDNSIKHTEEMTSRAKSPSII